MASAAQPAADGGDGAGAGAGDDSGNDFHKIKQISFFGRKAPIIMQNVDTATYFGVDKFGAAQCVEEAAEEQNDAIHLQLEADPETGLAFLVNPHWHFERGAPFVLRGVGKTETDRTVSEVRCAHHARVCTCMIVA